MIEPWPDDLTRRTFLKSAGVCSAFALASGAALPAEAATAPADGEKNEMKVSYEDIKAELEEYGYVVLHNLISRDDAGRAEERVKEIMRAQPDAGKTDQHLPGFFNHLDAKDDPLFLPLVTQPVFLEAAKRMLGPGFQMTETGCRWRKPGSPEGPIHGSRPLETLDRAGLPAPNVCFVLAFSWMLNDLTKDMGATLYLPFSQHAPHGPRPGVRYKHLVAVEAPAGSAILHHGAVWHHFGANTTKDKARVGFMGGYFPFWMDPVAVGWQPMKRSVRERLPADVQKMNKHVIDG